MRSSALYAVFGEFSSDRAQKMLKIEVVNVRKFLDMAENGLADVRFSKSRVCGVGSVHITTCTERLKRSCVPIPIRTDIVLTCT